MPSKGGEDPSEGASGKLPAKMKTTGDVLLPEIVEAIRQEGTRVDVNVLLVQLVSKVENPNDIITQSERLLEVAQKFEDHRVANFTKMAHAVIEAKKLDPDEVDKRRNNRARRALKLTVAGVLVVAVAGAVTSTILGGGIVVTGLFVIIGALALAMAGPLATGESMSPTDVVRIVGAFTKALPTRWELKAKEEDEQQSRKGRKKGGRR